LGTSDVIVGIHSFVQDPCHNLGGSARLDTASARAFLSPYGISFP
jgi:hypothetical protein